MPIHMGYVIVTVILAEIFLRVFQGFPLTITQTVTHLQTFSTTTDAIFSYQQTAPLSKIILSVLLVAVFLRTATLTDCD